MQQQPIYRTILVIICKPFSRGDEIIILKNGKEVARLVSYGSSVSFLTDSLTGVLKNDYDDKAIRAERIVVKNRESCYNDLGK